MPKEQSLRQPRFSLRLEEQPEVLEPKVVLRHLLLGPELELLLVQEEPPVDVGRQELEEHPEL